MPKVLRRNIPPHLYEHLLDRIQERNINRQDVTLLVNWLDKYPEVPHGKWFKRFPRMIACGEGEMIKTFLLSNQIPFGDEVF